MIKHYTPNILADSAEKLLETQPLESISVQAIVDACGTTRTTFYRYFKDKYDIMNWVYKRKADSIVNSYIDSDTIEPMVRELLAYFESRKQFYLSFMKYTGQNSFDDFINEYGAGFYLERIRRATGSDKVPEDLHMLVDGYCHGSMYLIAEWLRNGCDIHSDQLADIICRLVPEPISKYLY